LDEQSWPRRATQSGLGQRCRSCGSLDSADGIKAADNITADAKKNCGVDLTPLSRTSIEPGLTTGSRNRLTLRYAWLEKVLGDKLPT
jgi:hypothetical protein